jgi:hypothetical protein
MSRSVRRVQDQELPVFPLRVPETAQPVKLITFAVITRLVGRVLSQSQPVALPGQVI